MTGNIPQNKLAPTFWNQMMRPEKSLIKDSAVKQLAARTMGGLAHLVGNIVTLGFMWRATHRTEGPATPLEKKAHLLAAKKAITKAPMFTEAMDKIEALHEQKFTLEHNVQSGIITNDEALEECEKLPKKISEIIKSLPPDVRVTVIEEVAKVGIISDASAVDLIRKADVD
jgi:hypothetical protein